MPVKMNSARLRKYLSINLQLKRRQKKIISFSRQIIYKFFNLIFLYKLYFVSYIINHLLRLEDLMISKYYNLKYKLQR